MKTSDFSYHLPEERIAQTPAEPRDHSRLLQVDRQSGKLSHHFFYDLPNLLRTGDVLVLNNTKVMPVRLFGQKETGGKIEVLLTKRYGQDPHGETWQALTKPGLKVGQKVIIQNDRFRLEIIGEIDEGYTRKVRTSLSGIELLSALDQLGELPTPPYIESFVGDPERYQTIFAKEAGSAAAPTAGLHFTPGLLERLREHGIDTVEVTLHVGLGTFLPVKVDDVTAHHMHTEQYEILPEAAEKINQAKQSGQRVIAVGTTSMRTLESAAEGKLVQAGRADTALFVYPPYPFQICDGLITNFHLPQSTLLMLVSAFTSAPQTDQSFTTFDTSLLGQAYAEAIQENYRFYSFGDAMLIL